MNRSTHRYAVVILLLLAVLVMAACQRERPAAQQEGWTTPAVETSGTTDAVVSGTPATTVVAVGTPAPGGQVAPGGFVTGTLATPVPVVTPTSAAAIVQVGATFGYVVKAGDTLSDIALTYNTDVETIRSLNSLPDNTIQVGQVLIVPGTGEIAAGSGQEDGSATAPQATPAAQVTHVVDAGENLSSIAAQFDVAWQDIAAANNIPAPYTIYRGQKLVIPGVTATPQPAAQGRKHVVQPGETMYGVAVQYGVTVQAIMQANGLTDPNYLRVGQELIIPE